MGRVGQKGVFQHTEAQGRSLFKRWSMQSPVFAISVSVGNKERM